MTMTDVHQDTRDPHLPGAAARRLAQTTAALHRDVMLTPMCLVVAVVAIDNMMEVDGVVHHPSGDPSLSLLRLLLLHHADIGIEMMNRPSIGIVDQQPADLCPGCVEVMVETEDQEMQGVVIEQDPLHLQIPLAHHLPEDLRGGAIHQSPHVAAVRHLDVDDPHHHYPDLVLVR